VRKTCEWKLSGEQGQRKFEELQIYQAGFRVKGFAVRGEFAQSEKTLQ
jgi:hypothetical protein